MLKTAACAALGLYLVLSGLWWAWGMHDNDWPLLMWLAHNWSLEDLSPLLLGHYGPAQLLLVRALPFNTLATAKLLNAAATVACAGFVYGIARQLAPKNSADRAWGLIALALFALSNETLLTGQSEFADPLALCALLAGLYWQSGALIGLAGWFRVHFFVFGAGVVLLLCWQRRTVRPLSTWLPVVLPWWLLPHATSINMMLGQVVHPCDGWDFANGCGKASFSAADVPALARVMAQRVLECPKRLWLLVLLTTWGIRQSWFYWLCAVGYYLGVLAIGWSMTTRLLLPFVALLCLGTVAALAHRQWQHRAVLALLAFVVLRFVINGHAIGEELQRASDSWDASEQLTDLLRTQGMSDPREAFVVDWRRAPSDTQTLSAFDNYGFWNQLVPRYALERPVPHSSRDFKRNGVRWVVWSNVYPDVRPGEDLHPVGGRTTDSVFSVSLEDAAGVVEEPLPSRRH